ncbi:tetratricopeptide repeat protein, partial [Chloroflexota bacterium]
EKAMNAGNTAAWDHEWDRAIAAYGRAVQEFPEDPDAHRSLGLALLQAKRLEEALKVYTRANQLAPDDPIPLEKSADVLERMGRLREAAQQYIKVADIYISQRDLDKAIGNWERATQLTTGLASIHAKLATAYERTGEKKKAIREYLTLAFVFQRMDNNDKAIQAVQRALRLERDNAQALNTLQALQSQMIITAPINDDTIDGQAQRQDAFGVEPIHPEAQVGDSDPRGPVGEAEEVALTNLATHVFETGELSGGSAFAIQAIELHRQGNIDAAIASYEQALTTNFSHMGVHFCLGALYLQGQEYRKAIEHFSLTLADGRLSAGTHHGLGQAYKALNDPRKAAKHLVETLRIVDLSLAVEESEQDQLNAIYNDLQQGIPDSDEDQLLAMNERFFSLLTGVDWKQRVAETRRQLEGPGGISSKIEQAAEGSEELSAAVTKVDQYIRDGYYTLAMDEAHYAIEIAPTYLPIHLRMAQVLLVDNQMQAAIKKYRIVADTYISREQTDRAATILNEVLQIAPMDLEVRTSLLQMLEQEERWPEVLDQYIDMADAYYQLADFDMARETYEKARAQAEQLDANTDQITHILHRIADIDVTRMDLRQALRIYQQIKTMAPQDERARKALLDLNYRLNNRVDAIKELDELMRLYAQQQRSDLITQVLEEQVAMYPDEMALRSRLAALYAHVGRTDAAVGQLDALGELQLDAGMHSDAANTIRQIIALNPPGIEDYKQLLSTLGG